MGDSIAERLMGQARTRPEHPAYHVRSGDRWVPTPYREYAAEVRRAARAMIALGFAPGQTACVLGFNRPEWAIFHIGCIAAGGAPAGIYTTSSPSEVAYILGHAEAPILLLESRAQWDRLKDAIAPIATLKRIVFMAGQSAEGDPRLMGWEAFLALGDSVPDARVDERMAALEPDGLATLIYTSGTTGPPKGVMLSHRNLSFVSDVAGRLVNVTPNDRMLSYLPLSHISEQAFSILGPAGAGYSIYFAESLEKVPDNLKEVQPTIFFGVPRIWEKFYAGITGKLSGASPTKKKLFAWASGVGRRATDAKNHGKAPSGLLAVEYALAKKLIYSKLKPAVGLGAARVCVSGAAPIPRHVIDFFAGLDIIVHEVYGQSEDTGPTSFNLPGRTRFGSVGQAVAGVEVKIADDGEILVRGPNVFLGYYKEPRATAETLEEGWLHSGDLGTLDAEGFLRITGRKKEIIITAGGKNIAPVNIEAAIKQLGIVEEAVVIGDARPYLTALVTLNAEAATKLVLSRGGLPGAAVHESPIVRDEIEKWIAEVNKDLARVETVKKFRVLGRSFTVDGGELTPSLKIKRRVVDKNYAAEIEAMYAGADTAAS